MKKKLNRPSQDINQILYIICRMYLSPKIMNSEFYVLFKSVRKKIRKKYQTRIPFL
jgi:hypothetical protein